METSDEASQQMMDWLAQDVVWHHVAQLMRLGGMRLPGLYRECPASEEASGEGAHHDEGH